MKLKINSKLIYLYILYCVRRTYVQSLQPREEKKEKKLFCGIVGMYYKKVQSIVIEDQWSRLFKEIKMFF
jgi:hypothetical protein